MVLVSPFAPVCPFLCSEPLQLSCVVSELDVVISSGPLKLVCAEVLWLT